MHRFEIKTLSVLFLLYVSVICATGNVLHVPEDFPTIAAALDNVQSLDTVLVASGVYSGADYVGDENSPIGVTIMGSGWPCGTILTSCEDCPLPNVFYLESVGGWRITNLEMMWADWGVRMTNTSGCEVDHNFIHDMLGDPGWGCPVTTAGNAITLDIHHNLITRCDAGIFIGWEALDGLTQDVRIYNNTIMDIWGHGLDAIQFRGATPNECLITNNIVDKCLGQAVEFALCKQNDTEISYNCVIETDGAWAEDLQAGPGNIFSSPQFARRGGFPDYFFLDPESPCIDAGNPNLPLDPDNTISDMGAFATTQLNAPQRNPGHLQFWLEPCYPNPFNSTTQIRFVLSHTAPVRIALYNVRGQFVEEIASQQFDAGSYSLPYYAGNNASGMYFVRMTSEEFAATQKLLLVK